MASKLTFLIVAAAALAAAILVLRQDRLELSNQIADAHHQIDRARYGLWDQQARIAQRLDAGKLLDAIDRSGMEFESLTPTPSSDLPGATRPVLMRHAARE